MTRVWSESPAVEVAGRVVTQGELLALAEGGDGGHVIGDIAQVFVIRRAGGPWACPARRGASAPVSVKIRPILHRPQRRDEVEAASCGAACYLSKCSQRDWPFRLFATSLPSTKIRHCPTT